MSEIDGSDSGSTSGDLEDPEVTAFIDSLKLDLLCNVATSCRDGLSCHLGDHITGGYNIVQELVFSDNVTWLARIPIVTPSSGVTPEESVLSYVAVLKCIKRQTTIPVPEVYYYALKSDSKNEIEASFLLMERLPGHELDPEYGEEEDRPLYAKKIHEQLTDMMIELASIKFDKIGSLREGLDGNFFVAEYIDPETTGFVLSRKTAFDRLKSEDRGPYSSVSHFYRSSCLLGKEQARIDADEFTKDAIEEFETLEQMIPKFIKARYEHGPFAIGHYDLTARNILVDDDFNITGVIDFPGTVGPLQSLCVPPWLCYDDYAGPMMSRPGFKEVFTTRVSSNAKSPLASIQVRKELFKSGLKRAAFELSLRGVYTSLSLPPLYRHIYQEWYRGNVIENLVDNFADDEEDKDDGGDDELDIDVSHTRIEDLKVHSD